MGPWPSAALWGRRGPNPQFLATFASSIRLCSALEIGLEAQIQPGVHVCPACSQYQPVTPAQDLPQVRQSSAGRRSRPSDPLLCSLRTTATPHG